MTVRNEHPLVGIAKRRLASVKTLISHGKGTWPNRDYVTDNQWESWHAEMRCLESLLNEAERIERTERTINERDNDEHDDGRNDKTD